MNDRNEQQAEKRMTMRDGLKMLVLASLVLVTAAACTKKRELENKVDPKAYLAKSDLQGKLFHLSRGIEDASDENEFYATPGFSEDFGIVKAEITETELKFRSVFRPSAHEKLPDVVASFPITDHFDIVREENDFKEQTNKIVEDRQATFDKRQYIRVDFTKPSNELSQFTSQIYGRNLKEVNQNLIESVKIEDGHISFAVESGIEGMQAANHDTAIGSGSPRGAVSVVYRVHLMPVKNSDFQAKQYRLKDFEKFGYFTTQQNFLDPEKGLQDKNIRNYPWLFNVCEPNTGKSCSTNQIKWVLNKGFNREYLEETRRAVQDWNKAFKEALSRTDDVVVLDEATEVEISDPRHNVIVLYPHRTSGLLGVAQGVRDPRTGETISARSSVYEDAIKASMGHVDTLIDVVSSEDPLSEVLGINAAGSPMKAAQTAQEQVQNLRVLRAQMKALGLDKKPRGSGSGISELKNMAGIRAGGSIKPGAIEPAFLKGAKIAAVRKEKFLERGGAFLQFDDLKRVGPLASLQKGVSENDLAAKFKSLGGVERLMLANEYLKTEKQRFLHQSEHGVHGAELVEDAVVRYLVKQAADAKDIQQFKAAKASIKEKAGKLIYYTTLVHEMGHTFGLRHNFAGSADKKHYYPEYHQIAAQLKKGDKSVRAEDLVPLAASSIMDYGADFFSQAAGVGPYDKAAIKFGYRRDLNRDTDPLATAGYKFCTDHQVDESLLCRRFDKGSNISEVTQGLIEAYNANWMLSHYRRGRALFDSATGELAMRNLSRTMIPVRQVMDEFVYQLISSPAAQSPASKCSDEFSVASIARGEIVDYCDALVAEAAGVDPSDLSTLAMGLFDPQTGQRRVPMSELAPGKLADLVNANLLAQNFFQDVIGSIEPGTFLAFKAPNTPESDPHTLFRLSGSGSESEQLADFAREQNLPESEVAGFVQQNLKNVTSLRVGRFAKLYESQVGEEGTMSKLESVGSFWDKYVATIALSIRDVNVSKYHRASLTGNVYSYPQTKRYAVSLFDRMIVGGDAIGSIPVQLKSGQVVFGLAEAKLSSDIQRIATVTALTDLVSDLDTSMLKKLRFCVAGEASCLNELGSEVVEVTDSLGSRKIRAIQTPEGDSIAFRILSKMKQSDDVRRRFATLKTDAPKLREENKAAINALLQTSLGLLEQVAKIQGLEKSVVILQGGDQSNPTGLVLLSALNEQGEQVALNTYFDFSNRIGADLAVVVDEVTKHAQSVKTPESEQLLKDVTALVDAAKKLTESEVQLKIAPKVVEIRTRELEQQESNLDIMQQIIGILSL